MTLRYRWRSSPSGSGIAALLIRMSMRPCRCSMSRKVAAKRVVSLTSQAMWCESGADCCSCGVSAASRSSRRASATTVAPVAANSSARRWPIPDDAPVTTAIDPGTLNIVTPSGQNPAPSSSHRGATSAPERGLLGLPADRAEVGGLGHLDGEKPGLGVLGREVGAGVSPGAHLAAGLAGVAQDHDDRDEREPDRQPLHQSC